MYLRLLILGVALMLSANVCHAEREFAGLNFGVGISLTHDVGSNARVKSASVVNGIVRVNDENNDIARIMLESHYFFTTNRKFLGSVSSLKWGWGPFMALQPGTDDIVEALGGGLMIGFKRSDDPSDTSSWNVGFGLVIDPNKTILGDGITENQPLPPGETEVRLKEKSQLGILVISSFTF